MRAKKLTATELLLLGLVSEMPRHGYELEQVIAQRGMGEWTPIGFSSIYFVLGKLEQKGFVASEVPASAKAKKRFSITPAGSEALVAETLEAFATIRSTASPLQIGLLHWSVLDRDQALGALQKRITLLQQELDRIEGIRFAQQPLPDYIDALFDHSLHQLEAESAWLTRTLDYMQTKPWPSP